MIIHQVLTAVPGPLVKKTGYKTVVFHHVWTTIRRTPRFYRSKCSDHGQIFTVNRPESTRWEGRVYQPVVPRTRRRHCRVPRRSLIRFLVFVLQRLYNRCTGSFTLAPWRRYGEGAHSQLIKNFYSFTLTFVLRRCWLIYIFLFGVCIEVYYIF